MEQLELFTPQMHDTYKPIKGFEGLYCVSKEGKVLSEPRTYKMWNGAVRSTRRKILKVDNRGSNRSYQFALLSKNGDRSYHRVDKLIAQAFVPNPHNYTGVCFKDGDPTNLRASNLYWCPED